MKDCHWSRAECKALKRLILRSIVEGAETGDESASTIPYDELKETQHFQTFDATRDVTVKELAASIVAKYTSSSGESEVTLTEVPGEGSDRKPIDIIGYCRNLRIEDNYTLNPSKLLHGCEGPKHEPRLTKDSLQSCSGQDDGSGDNDRWVEYFWTTISVLAEVTPAMRNEMHKLLLELENDPDKAISTIEETQRIKVAGTADNQVKTVSDEMGTSSRQAMELSMKLLWTGYK